MKHTIIAVAIVGLFSAANLGAFVNIYYICGGNKDSDPLDCF